MTISPKQRTQTPEPLQEQSGFINEQANEQSLQPEATSTESPGPAKFVTILHGRVGHYAQGSVVPSTVFEFLPNLLRLGAVAYNYEASEEFLAGDQAESHSVEALQLAQTQILPIAPWVTASAANILGAKYIPLQQTRGTWTQPSVENATKEVPFNTV